VDSWVIRSINKWQELDQLMKHEEFVDDINYEKLRAYLFERRFTLIYSEYKDYFFLEMPANIYDSEKIIPQWLKDDFKTIWMRKRVVFYWC
jgi:hypothetical protein